MIARHWYRPPFLGDLSYCTTLILMKRRNSPTQQKKFEKLLNKEKSAKCWDKKKERENKYLPEKKKSTVTVISLCSGFWKISGFEKVFLWEFSGCTRKLTRSHCLKWWWRPIIWLMLTRARDSCTARRLTFLHNRRTLFLPVIIRAWTVEMLPRKDFSRLWWKLKPTFFTYFWNFTKFQSGKHFSWFFGEFSSFFQF